MENYKEIKSVIDEYIKFMDELVTFEKKKLEVVSNKDMDSLNKYMKEEQVYLLQLRGLDQKREAAQAKLGVLGLTYRQIMEKMDGPDRAEMQDAYQLLSAKTKDFKNTINTIKSFIDLRLHIIDDVVGKLGGKNDSTSNTYGLSGVQLSSSKEPTGRFQSTKV
jgi:hypothetical protein